VTNGVSQPCFSGSKSPSLAKQNGRSVRSIRSELIVFRFSCPWDTGKDQTFALLPWMPEIKGPVNLSLRQSLETAFEATAGDPNQIHTQNVGAIQATLPISKNDGSRSSLSPSLRMVWAGTWRRTGCEGSRLLPNPIVAIKAKRGLAEEGSEHEAYPYSSSSSIESVYSQD
jgi:hypothetical protein